MEDNKTSIACIVVSAVFISLALFIENEDWKLLFLGGLIGTVSILLINIIVWFLSVRKTIKVIIRSAFIKRLRLSCAYLYRIKVDDHYLLIKSRKHGKYQPVGGNFKKNTYSNSFLKDVEDDDKILSNGRADNDLRLYIPGYKLLKFLSWYNSAKREREITYDREFYEELIEPEILPQSLFPFPNINFIKQHIRPVTFSQHFNCYEVHIFDVVELVPSSKQMEFLKQLKAKGNTDTIKWATLQTIRSEGYQGIDKGSPYSITDHTRVIVNSK